ncbi:unnamed protein product [Durusdinium trenchii]|uniref:Uncharacterized protein n=1 Tax=Durusdinium trenchii TaxID=1381693 RepID=A0ABP0J0X8_9DINO
MLDCQGEAPKPKVICIEDSQPVLYSPDSQPMEESQPAHEESEPVEDAQEDSQVVGTELDDSQIEEQDEDGIEPCDEERPSEEPTTSTSGSVPTQTPSTMSPGHEPADGAEVAESQEEDGSDPADPEVVEITCPKEAEVEEEEEEEEAEEEEKAEVCPEPGAADYVEEEREEVEEANEEEEQVEDLEEDAGEELGEEGCAEGGQEEEELEEDPLVDEDGAPEEVVEQESQQEHEDEDMECEGEEVLDAEGSSGEVEDANMKRPEDQHVSGQKEDEGAEASDEEYVAKNKKKVVKGAFKDRKPLLNEIPEAPKEATAICEQVLSSLQLEDKDTDENIVKAPVAETQQPKRARVKCKHAKPSELADLTEGWTLARLFAGWVAHEEIAESLKPKIGFLYRFLSQRSGGKHLRSTQAYPKDFAKKVAKLHIKVKGQVKDAPYGWKHGSLGEVERFINDRIKDGKKDDEIADLLEDWFACAGDWAHSRTFQRLTNRKKRRHRVKYAYKTKLQLMDMQEHLVHALVQDMNAPLDLIKQGRENLESASTDHEVEGLLTQIRETINDYKEILKTVKKHVQLKMSPYARTSKIRSPTPNRFHTFGSCRRLPLE